MSALGLLQWPHTSEVRLLALAILPFLFVGGCESLVARDYRYNSAPCGTAGAVPRGDVPSNEIRPEATTASSVACVIASAPGIETGRARLSVPGAYHGGRAHGIAHPVGHGASRH